VKVAVLTLTRDRLQYTKHCFARLHEFAGCEFDHYVLDQGSADGTWQWLMNCRFAFAHLSLLRENVGISRGVNQLLDRTQAKDYDVIVKFDNDCELTQPDTLRIVSELALEGDALLSPVIAGLNRPPAARGQFKIKGETILDIPQIGGVFLAAPAEVFKTFRYDERNPVWGADDAQFCAWYRVHGGRCGYVARLEANHYETTSGQHSRYPEYFERTLAEGKPSL
jgi:Glycosyl transferase family 2